jgi:hypothetical protein
MKNFIAFAALGFASLASAPVANAQVLVTQPYQAVVVRPTATVIRETPLLAVTTAQPLQVVTVETAQIISPAVHHHVVASGKYQQRFAANNGRPLYNMAAAPAVQTPAVVTPVVQTAATPAVFSPGAGPGLSGQFQCVQGCAAGSPGPAFVTQNGWDLNVINEIGLPSRAWIDYPGHIWVQSWNEGAVYSADGMTIQFDNGTVWSKNVILLVPQAR